MKSSNLIFCLIALSLSMSVVSHAEEGDDDIHLAGTKTVGGGILIGDSSNGTSVGFGQVEATANVIGKSRDYKTAIVADLDFGVLIGAVESPKNVNKVGAGYKAQLRLDYLYTPLGTDCSPAGGLGVDLGGTRIFRESNSPADIGIGARFSLGIVCATKKGRAFSLLGSAGVGTGVKGDYDLLSLRGKYLIDKNLALTASATVSNSSQPTTPDLSGPHIRSYDRSLAGGIQLLNPDNHSFLGVEAGVADNETKVFQAATTQSSTAKIVSITGGFTFK